MKKFVVNKFDENTYVVIELEEQREICVCGNYEDWDDAKERAEQIALLLNDKLRGETDKQIE